MRLSETFPQVTSRTGECHSEFYQNIMVQVIPQLILLQWCNIKKNKSDDTQK